MPNIVKPTLSFLPMEDIAAELKSNKNNRKFMTKDDKAADVNKVAGIESERIAIAVSPTERTTIDNALKLNGKDASEYLSRTEGDKIIGISNVMSELYSSEIRNVRDELMQLETQLLKNGFINDVVPYEGFMEGFKRGNVKYEGYICGISKAIIGNTTSLYISDISQKRYFEPGKKFVIKRTDTDTEVVVTSEGITSAGKVTFNPLVNILDSVDAVQICKSSGEYIRDSFSFSEIRKDVANPLKERYHMQSDDTRTSLKTINKSNSGYAVYFKVPNSAAGALTKFAIRAKAEGTPGSLLCHVLKKESILDSKGTLKVDFKNIDEAKAKGYWMATSQPIQSSLARTEQELFFDFFDIANNKYPKLDGSQYLFIIECVGATDLDNWKIRFSYFENENFEEEDLQKYNCSFCYEKVQDTGLGTDEDAIKVIDDIHKYDLLFSLVTRELIEEDEMGKQEGLYTAKILLPKPIDVSRARLTTRINKEGCYYVLNHDSNYTIFTLEKETSTSHPVSDNRFKEDDIVIIGNQFARVKRSTSNQIEIKEPIHIDPRVLKFYSKTVFNSLTGKYETQTRLPLYRMNYDVFIKPSLIDWETWDSTRNEFATTDLSQTPVRMDLKYIIPDGLKDNTRISDRLIFEASFGRDANDIAMKANEFELQIYWKSPFAYNEINDFKDLSDNNFKELIGRLHDIVLSFDKNY